MGYTHYFQLVMSPTPKQWENLTRDVQVLLDQADIPLTSDNEEVLLPPVVNESEIVFEGEREDSCETFILERSNQAPLFGFCKTQQRSYDLYVCAVLILASYHCPGCYDISSDGSPSDWQPALDLVNKMFECNCTHIIA